jgi:SAM-dependent methyltransferase
MSEEIYLSGEYLKKYPTWHVEDSSWKASQIIKMMRRNNIEPQSICEIGCGAGRILAYLQRNMPNKCLFFGYEISPQAFELCNKLVNKKLTFKLMNIENEKDLTFDLILLIDVIEHVKDYYSLLRELKLKSRYIILHIPLELTVYNVIRNKPLLDTRQSGHLHYFTMDIALKVLQESGFEILDYFYTGSSIELPSRSIKDNIFNLLRRPFFSLHQDLAVRMLGGYSLMVLAK